MIARKIARLRASIREAIHAALGDIAKVASAKPPVQPLGPPLRFYAEGYRVFSLVDPHTRCVVVFELRRAFT